MAVGGPFELMTKADIDLTLLGSLAMLLYGAHAALERMLAQGSGKIVNIGAAGGRIQNRGLVVYNSCQAGVVGCTRNLAREMAPRGISVTGVAPAIMVTPELVQMVLDPQNDQQRAGRGAILESIQTNVQLGQVSLPEEVANTVAYLCSEAADYMCGQTIDVAGGQWMN